MNIHKIQGLRRSGQGSLRWTRRLKKDPEGRGAHGQDGDSRHFPVLKANTRLSAASNTLASTTSCPQGLLYPRSMLPLHSIERRSEAGNTRYRLRSMPH